jgi:2-iminobutanoate/2-iminopropanoate deaminase
MTSPHLAPFSEAGDLVFLSGQLSIKAGQFVGGDIAVQTRQVLDNISDVLSSLGLGLGDVVKTTVWLTQASDFAAFNEAYASVLGDIRPARSTVIAGLALPQALIEIEAIARRQPAR